MRRTPAPHLLPLLLLLLTLALLPHTTARRLPPAPKVLLSSVRSLTFHADRVTAHRRVPAIPQLTCLTPRTCALYQPDLIRCENVGAGYGAEDVQWRCTARLPPEFRLGGTEVRCEGYNGPEDEYVLTGSCGVAYRLLLTEAGERRYGALDRPGWGERAVEGGFWVVFGAVAVWILYSMWTGGARGRGGAGRAAGGDGGWGGWGGGGGGPDDPPPPYEWRPGPLRKTYATSGAAGTGGWQPGFWTGALGGAAAGYFMGRGRGEENRRGMYGREPYGSGGWGWGGGGRSGYDRGEGSSRSSGGVSSARYESSGFGGTSRR